jgi:trk system potassium uptake protein
MKKKSDYNFASLLMESHLTHGRQVKGPLLVLGYFGYFLIVIGLLVMLPLLMLAFYPSEANEYLAFLIPGGSALLLGFIFFLFIFRRPQGKLSSIEELVLVIGVWILVILFSAIPFLFYGYNFTQALFEATSGYTSAGLTIMNWGKEIKTLSDGTTDVFSHMLFFHRALTELVGGIGLVLVVSSAISERSGLNLYLLEGHNDKLLPNLVKSARLIFSLYLGFIVIGSLLYIAVGVEPFDAVCHSMTAVATGGFSTKANNINSLVQEVSMNGEWRGILVEVITEILMVLGGTNFVIHYSLLRRKFNVLRHFEFLVFFVILLVVWPFMIVGFAQYFGGNIAAGFRYGTFEMISGMSTAGFQAVDSYQAHALTGSVYASSSTGIYGFTSIDSSMTTIDAAIGYASGTMVKFPTYLLFLLGLMMMVGMQNGSTSGAIKQNRIGLLFMDIKYRILAAVGKQEEYRVRTTYKFGVKTKVSQEEITEAETFIGMYVATVLLGTCLISAITYGCGLTRGDGTGDAFTFTDVFFEFSSAVGTVGLGCGITSYANSLTAAGAAILWIEMIGMLLGRLEIFVYFHLFGKIYRHIRHRKYIYHPEKETKTEGFEEKEKWSETNIVKTTHATQFDFSSRKNKE